MSLTQQAHQALSSHLETLGVKKFQFSIDATCGNGFDTLFLAETTEETVFSFDIQAVAIQNTQQLLSKTVHANKVQLIHQNHSEMLNYCQQQHPTSVGKIDAITFNLGYLPRADKSITTTADSTIAALNAASQLLSKNGVISIICYRGHDGGLMESKTVLEWLSALKWHYTTVNSTVISDTTPFLLIITPNETT